MGVEKRSFVVFQLMIFMVSMESSMAALHRVGGKAGWNPNVNYSEWSDHERFYVGDWLRKLSPFLVCFMLMSIWFISVLKIVDQT